MMRQGSWHNWHWCPRLGAWISLSSTAGIFVSSLLFSPPEYASLLSQEVWWLLLTRCIVGLWSKRAKSIRREQGQVWKRLQCQEKPRQDQLQELRNEVNILNKEGSIKCTLQWRNQCRTAEPDEGDPTWVVMWQLWEAKLMECTFTPQINHRRMGDGGREDMKDGPFNRFELLFMDAESRRRRQTEYMQWYPEGSVQVVSLS